MLRLLRKLVSPDHCWGLIVTAMLFVVIAQFVPQNKLAIVINGVDIAVGTFILFAYVPALGAEMKRRGGEPHLLAGIVLLWTALMASRIWSLALILAGKPAWMINHWFQTFCYLTVALSGFYFLRIDHSTKSHRYIAYAIALAVFIITFFLAFVEG